MATAPVTSIWQVFLTLAIAAVTALLFAAPGVVHSAHGMPDGAERTVVMAVGTRALAVATAAHLTGPWNALQSALGHQDSPSTPPLLAAAPTALPHSAASATTRPHLVRAQRQGRASPHGPAPRAPPPRLLAPARATRAHPVRLLITGDSLPGYLGPQILNALVPSRRALGWTETHDGTGLTRPDFVDWSVVARQEMQRYAPDATVVFMGGNDFQNMVVGSGRVLVAGTSVWTREYARRAAICMRVWTRGLSRNRVYWLSLPPARDPGWAHDFAQINVALRQAARQTPGAEFIDTLGPITHDGRYADFVSVGGQSTLIREPDGIHLNIVGSQLVGQEVVQVIRREWRLP